MIFFFAGVCLASNGASCTDDGINEFEEVCLEMVVKLSGSVAYLRMMLMLKVPSVNI